jgi:hypothetical protein
MIRTTPSPKVSFSASHSVLKDPPKAPFFLVMRGFFVSGHHKKAVRDFKQLTIIRQASLLGHTVTSAGNSPMINLPDRKIPTQGQAAANRSVIATPCRAPGGSIFNGTDSLFTFLGFNQEIAHEATRLMLQDVAVNHPLPQDIGLKNNFLRTAWSK